MDEEIPNSYSFSQEEQTNAAKVYRNLRQCRLSRENPTYIHLTVELNGHWAAVQIVVTPRPHPQFRRQRIFSPLYRYNLCCQSGSSSTEDAGRRKVSQAVQNIIGVNFQLGGWDFSDQDCFTRDPGFPDRPSQASCISIADAALRRYVSQVGGVSGTSGKTGGTRRKCRKRQRTAEPASQILRLGEYPQSSEGSSPGTANACKNPGPDQTSDLELILKITQKIRMGLIAMHSRGIEENFLSLDGQKHSYTYYAIKLQEAAEKFRQDSQAKKAEFWYASFLSGCAYLVNDSLPPRPVELSSDGSLRITEQSTSSLCRWRSVARFTNAIITGLYRTWKEKAFLIIRALAEKKYYLTVISNFGSERLRRIADGVVGRMQNPVPEIDAGQSLFDPTFYLGQLMQVDYSVVCGALQLPMLSTPRAQSGGYLGALTAVLRFKPPNPSAEANSPHASELNGMGSEEVVAATRESEDPQEEANLKDSGSLARHSSSSNTPDLVHRCATPQSAATPPCQSELIINAGLRNT
ncbi:MAG: hypothetical protein M1839_004173 [Geoglossum umbratile]|nr:MAG: hypothetical protein M1839_004173 [Geoglossum umbratile]